MFNNISNCEITVNNYSNPSPSDNNNNNSKRNASRPLESFPGFKRQSVDIAQNLLLMQIGM
jgi:hypothetical protein